MVAPTAAIAEMRTWYTLLLNEKPPLGGRMKKEWQVHRTVVECSDGQLRWDCTYQLLLRWMMEQNLDKQHLNSPAQENDHENRPLCQSFDQPSNAEPEHRTTD